MVDSVEAWCCDETTLSDHNTKRHNTKRLKTRGNVSRRHRTREYLACDEMWRRWSERSNESTPLLRTRARERASDDSRSRCEDVGIFLRTTVRLILIILVDVARGESRRAKTIAQIH